MRLTADKNDPDHENSLFFLWEGGAIVFLDGEEVHAVTADTEKQEIVQFKRDKDGRVVRTNQPGDLERVTRKGKVEIFLQCPKSEARGRLISKKDLGEDWPFISEIVEGFVFNRNGALTFRYETTEFALNGMATSQGYPSVEPILANPYPDALSNELRKIHKPLDKIIEFGLNIKDR